MMEILKKLGMVFVFIISGVFALVSLVFASITWVFGKGADLLSDFAIKIDEEPKPEEDSGEEVPA